MKTLFETLRKNSVFSTLGNGQFGNVVRSGWRVSRLGDKKNKAILDALNDSNIDSVYRRGNKIYSLSLNGVERLLK